MGFAVKGWLVQRRAAGPTVGRTGRLGDLACWDEGQSREAPKAPAGERQLEGASLAQAQGLTVFRIWSLCPGRSPGILSRASPRVA